MTAPLILAPREVRVLGLVADGLSDRAIGSRLGVSEDAVRPLLSAVPRCPLHPLIALLPEQCWACRQWECAQGLVADVDALLRGGPDA